MEAARAFVRDPQGCDERDVVLVKRAACDALAIAYENDTFFPVRIGALGEEGDCVHIRILVDNGDSFLVRFAPHGVDVVGGTRPMFSTDPNDLVGHLRCDGGCGRAFGMDDLVYTDFEQRDFHVGCEPSQPHDLTLARVEDRVRRESVSRMNALVSALDLPFAVHEDDTPSGS